MDEILAPSRTVGVRSFSSATYQPEIWCQNCMLSGQHHGKIVIGLADNSPDPTPEDHMRPLQVLSVVGLEYQSQPTNVKIVSYDPVTL